eukprot:TRINITY_DN5411_c0_g1_i3.p1 TRINITY_DN5411_c0_g1~~TRINITY_DN5411_c0_g1_i3.p1  ORF type:complete len:645 (+),score=121.27 TRINITY_DN5411_c0_g1_i3:232-2166(+)
MTLSSTSSQTQLSDANDKMNILSYQQESYLKKTLLKLSIQQELAQLFQNPNYLLEDSVLLKYLYIQALSIPFFNKEGAEKAKQEFERLCLSLPSYITTGHIATKKDQDNRRLRIFVAKIYDLVLRTPLERLHDNDWSYSEKSFMEVSEHFKGPEIEKEINKETERRAKIHLLGNEISNLSQAIFSELSQDGGTEKLAELIKETENLTDMPQIYQKFLENGALLISILMEREMNREARWKKWKKFAENMPVRSIKIILSYSNISKLVYGLLTIFTARPFGSHSLMMKIAKGMVEYRTTQTRAEEKKKEAVTHLRRYDCWYDIIYSLECHVQNFGFEEHIVEQGTEETNVNRRVFSDSLIQDVLRDYELDEAVIASLTTEDFSGIREWLVLEVRLKEKEKFIDMLGSEEMVSMIRILLPVIYGPLNEVFVKADAGTHFSKMFKLVKRMVQIGEKIKKENIEDSAARTTLYWEALQLFKNDVWEFIRALVLADEQGDRILEDLLSWFMHIFRFFQNKESLDVQKLLVNVDQPTRQQIISEIDAEIKYNKWVMHIGENEKIQPVEKKESPTPHRHHLKLHLHRKKHSEKHSEKGLSPKVLSPRLSGSPRSPRSPKPREKVEVVRPEMKVVKVLVPDFMNIIKDRLESK